MEERIYLDMLTQNGVSLRKQRVLVLDGQEYKVGEPWRKAYINSERGRQQVQEEVPEPFKSAIFAVWGDTPTVDESVSQ